MDLYIHHKHRSLSKTPWEVYYARSSPHQLKYITQLESFSPSFVESCSKPNPDEIISNIEMYNLTNEMRVHVNLRERMTIHTLTQTRNIQIENHLKITQK